MPRPPGRPPGPLRLSPRVLEVGASLKVGALWYRTGTGTVLAVPVAAARVLQAPPGAAIGRAEKREKSLWVEGASKRH